MAIQEWKHCFRHVIIWKQPLWSMWSNKECIQQIHEHMSQHWGVWSSTCIFELSRLCDLLDLQQQRPEQWRWRRRRVCQKCSGTAEPPASGQWAESLLHWCWTPNVGKTVKLQHYIKWSVPMFANPFCVQFGKLSLPDGDSSLPSTSHIRSGCLSDWAELSWLYQQTLSSFQTEQQCPMQSCISSAHPRSSQYMAEEEKENKSHHHREKMSSCASRTPFSIHIYLCMSSLLISRRQFGCSNLDKTNTNNNTRTQAEKTHPESVHMSE